MGGTIIARAHVSVVMMCIQGGAKRTHVFQIIVTLFIFNMKKIMLTPK